MDIGNTPGVLKYYLTNYLIWFNNNKVLFWDRSNDVWCLNLDSYSWHKQATSNLKPQPRYGQCQIELGDKHLLVLGEISRKNNVEDVSNLKSLL